jgi:transcriptional regulator with XRE-family HTH domain
MTEENRIISVEEARDRLQDRRLSYVAESIGVTYMSLSRLVKGEGNPSLKVLKGLTDYFNDRP